MEVLFVAIPLTLLIVIGAVVLFLWAMKNGQFDDLDTPAHRVLFEDNPQPASNSDSSAKIPTDIAKK